MKGGSNPMAHHDDLQRNDHGSGEKGRQENMVAAGGPRSSGDEASSSGVIGHLDHELQAMGALLRRDLDERLRGLEAGAGLAPPRGASPARRFWHGLGRHRHDLFAAALLAGLLFFGWQVRALRLQSVAGSTPGSTGIVATQTGGRDATVGSVAESTGSGTPQSGTSSEAGSEATAAVPNNSPDPVEVPVAALPIDLEDPVASWRAYLNDHRDRLPGWATAVATFQGPGAAEMSRGQRQRFEGFAATPASAVQNADLCLRGLFELAMRTSLDHDPGGTIDLDLREYDTAAVSAVAASLGLGADVLPTHDASAARVQAAVAVAWLERRVRQE